jgi:hypothetical protein
MDWGNKGFGFAKATAPPRESSRADAIEIRRNDMELPLLFVVFKLLNGKICRLKVEGF